MKIRHNKQNYVKKQVEVFMNWNKEILTKIKFDNISNLEEKKKSKKNQK